MQLYLIQDCTTSHVIDAIELIHGYKISSCLSTIAKKHGLDPKYVSYLTRCGSASSFEVFEESGIEITDGNYGIWFLLYLLDYVSINCDTKQIDWCFHNKESSSIKYLENEEYNLNLEELFDHSQRLIDYMEDSEYNAVDRHESLKHLLYNQVLPTIVISQQEVDLLSEALNTQEECIKTLNKRLETLNHTTTACKTTLINLRPKLLPELVKHPQLRALYPEATLAIKRRLEIEAGKLRTDTLGTDTQAKLEEVTSSIKHLQKKYKRSVSKGWKHKNSQLLEEKGTVLEIYLATEGDMEKAREMEIQALNAKVKATQIKEELRNTRHRLQTEPKTYGYDLPSSHCASSITHSHLSLYDAVLGVIQDVTQEVGRRHMLECNWIIEQCKVTELSWNENPDIIPTTDKIYFDRIDEDFVVLNEPDVFTLILERISTQCVFTVGRLLKLLPRIQSTPSATTRLILTYETIIYRRVTEYILPLFELRYKGVLDKLTQDMRLLSWQELDVEEEWLIKLLTTNSSPINDNHTPEQMELRHTIHSFGRHDSATLTRDDTSGSAVTTNAIPGLSSATLVLPSLSLSKSNSRTPSDSRGQSDSGYHEMVQSPSEPNRMTIIADDVIVDSQTVDDQSDITMVTSETTTQEADVCESQPLAVPSHNDCVLPQGPISSTPLNDISQSVPTHGVSEVQQSQNYLGQSGQSSLAERVPDTNPVTCPEGVSSQKLAITSALSADNSFFTAIPDNTSFHSPVNTHNVASLGDSRTEVSMACRHGNSVCSQQEGSSEQTDHPSSIELAGRECVMINDSTDLKPRSSSIIVNHADISIVASQEGTCGESSRSESFCSQETPEADTSAEIDDLLDDAMAFLDDDEANDLEKPTEHPQKPPTELRVDTNAAERYSRIHSIESSTQAAPKVPKSMFRSKSVGAKAKVRWNRLAVNSDKEQTTSPETPSSPTSLKCSVVKQKTLRNVESVLLKRKSRRSNRRDKSTETSSMLTGGNLFTVVFKDCISCLTNMHLCHSPLEKAQVLAKCLRYMSTTITQVRADSDSPTTSDDLITVAIVLLLNIPTHEFRSIYIQLKFISTYMDEFMDAGIHNFACVQFIGAMHFIQDQILTKKYRVSQVKNESAC